MYVQVPLPEPKNEKGSGKSIKTLFTQKFKDLIEHSKGQIRSSFRFENKNSCTFVIKKFELRSYQLILTEIFTHNYRENCHLSENCYSAASKGEIFESKYDV